MLVAYEVSKNLIPLLAPVVAQIAREDHELADQLRRAAASVLLNIGEGQRSLKGNKHKHYSIAHGSANEVRAALDVAMGWGWIAPPREALAKLDHALRLLWGLTRSR